MNRNGTSASLWMVFLVALVVVCDPGYAGSKITEKDVVTVTAKAVGSTITLGGTVVPLKDVTLSAQLPGRVTLIAGVEGDRFKMGTVLVALDERDLLAKRESVVAEIAKAQSALRNSHVQFQRQIYSGSDMASDNMGMGMPRMFDRMFTRPMSSMMWVDNPGYTEHAQNYAQGVQVEQAGYGLTQAFAKLKEIDSHLRDSKSIAPFSGIIVEKHVEKGNTVQPGMPLLSFADISKLRIKVDVPARLMSGIKEGMIILAKLDVGDIQVKTKVVQIFPMADPQRHTVTVKLLLDDALTSHGRLGMYADVMIPDVNSPVKNLPIVPKSAVLWRGSLPAVLAIGGGGMPELRMLRLGGSVDSDFVSVLAGLQVGDRIVASQPAGVMTGWGNAKDGSVHN